MHRLLSLLTALALTYAPPAAAQPLEELMAPYWHTEAGPAPFLWSHHAHWEPINQYGVSGAPVPRLNKAHTFTLASGEVLGNTYMLPIGGRFGLGHGLATVAQETGGFLEFDYPPAFDGKVPEDFCLDSRHDVKVWAQAKGATTSLHSTQAGRANPLPIGSAGHSDRHPHMHGLDTLYFSSNRPGGQGGWDIWRSIRTGDTWGTPQNLGPAVNTPADEGHPAADPGGRLHWACEGCPGGMGGVDLYHLQAGRPALLPYPANSKFDDVAIAFSNLRRGEFWVMSNRPYMAQGSERRQQLYRFSPKKLYEARAIGSRYGKPMPGTPMRVMSAQASSFVDADTAGWLRFFLSPGERYNLRIAIDGYDTLYKYGVMGDERPQPHLMLTEKNYCMATVNVMEFGKACQRSAWVAFYQDGKFLDSLPTKPGGTLMRDLAPQHAYLVRVWLQGYPSTEFTFTAPAKGKNNYTRNATFGLSSGTYVRATARDLDDSRVSGVKLEILQNGSPYTSVTPDLSNPMGQTGAVLPPKSSFTLLGWRDDHFGFNTFTTDAARPVIDTAEVTLRMRRIEPGSTLLSFKTAIDPILLQAGQAPEMAIARMLLERYPDLVLELGVHTDNRGSAEENLRRSRQAAEFAADYFKLKGIPAGRVKPKGYGESAPLNHCRDGVPCDPGELDVNNRVEFKVLAR